MKSIMVGIPTIRHHQGFWESMEKFLPELSKNHRTETVIVKNQLVDDARNQIADFFMSKDYDYLLFLDDDHTGHTMKMLDALLLPGEYICAIKCYCRGLPHLSTLMDYSGLDIESKRYESKDLKKGYDWCNLVGFGMTLIRRELFDKIDKPYFIVKNNQAEDMFFCDKIQLHGVKPLGCFEYLLPHDGIDDDNVEKLNNDWYEEIKSQIYRDNPDLVGKKLTLVM